MRIVDYKILWGEFGELEAEVKEKIQEGWQPIGGVSLKHDHDWNTVFYQAMVKYEESKLLTGLSLGLEGSASDLLSHTQKVVDDFRLMQTMAGQ